MRREGRVPVVICNRRLVPSDPSTYCNEQTDGALSSLALNLPITLIELLAIRQYVYHRMDVAYEEGTSTYRSESVKNIAIVPMPLCPVVHSIYISRVTLSFTVP